jgi:hypothetical protein
MDEFTDDLDFSSREASTVSTRPKLTIEFLPTSSSLIASSSVQSSSLQNGSNPRDVNADTQVTPLDALAIINALNRGSTEGEASGEHQTFYLDVSGDGTISPQDALLVINHLNKSSSTPGEGEGASIDLGFAAWLEATEGDHDDDLIIRSAVDALDFEEDRNDFLFLLGDEFPQRSGN